MAMALLLQFERASGSANFLQGKIIEILGRADDVDTQMRLVIEQFNLPFQFSEEVMQETEKLERIIRPGTEPRGSTNNSPCDN